MREVIALDAGQEAMFGYGSLLSRRSMERTLGGAYTGPFVTCSVRGWRRTWDVFLPNKSDYVTDAAVVPGNIVYLNVRPEANTSVNGILYVVTSAALAGFDAREWVYDRVDVTALLEGVEIAGGRAWIYVAKPEFVVASPRFPEYAVRQTYIDIVNQGLDELGPEFRTAYDASSDIAPADLIVHDRH